MLCLGVWFALSLFSGEKRSVRTEVPPLPSWLLCCRVLRRAQAWCIRVPLSRTEGWEWESSLLGHLGVPSCCQAVLPTCWLRSCFIVEESEDLTGEVLPLATGPHGGCVRSLGVSEARAVGFRGCAVPVFSASTSKGWF